MTRAYEYLFYRAYLWPARGSDAVRRFTAVVILSVIVCWHALAVLAFCEGLVGHGLIPGGLTTREGVVFFTLLLALQYVWFASTGRYRVILDRYSAEPANQRRLRSIAVFSYVLLSFILLICASVFRGNRLHT